MRKWWVGCSGFYLHFSESAPDNILATLDGVFANVIEFRHPGWWNDYVSKLLREKKLHSVA